MRAKRLLIITTLLFLVGILVSPSVYSMDMCSQVLAKTSAVNPATKASTTDEKNFDKAAENYRGADTARVDRIQIVEAAKSYVKATAAVMKSYGNETEIINVPDELFYHHPVLVIKKGTKQTSRLGIIASRLEA